MRVHSLATAAINLYKQSQTVTILWTDLLAYSASSNPLAAFKGPTSNRRERREGKREGKGRKGKIKEGMERKGKGIIISC